MRASHVWLKGNTEHSVAAKPSLSAARSRRFIAVSSMGGGSRSSRGSIESPAPRPPGRQSLIAACLSWGDRAAASHFGAAPLWSLTGFIAGPIEVTIPRSRHRSGPGTVHRTYLPPVDVTVVDAIPVTTVARTLIDLAAVADPNVLEEALDDALRRGLVSLARLRWRLNELASRGRPGIGVMRKLLDARDPTQAVPDSVFERRVLRVLRRGGVPAPIPQYQIRDRGRLVATVDFAFPEVKLAIEADGYRWHSGRIRWDDDRTRRNQLTLLGWRVIHVTWTDLVRRPENVIEQIRLALSRA